MRINLDSANTQTQAPINESRPEDLSRIKELEEVNAALAEEVRALKSENKKKDEELKSLKDDAKEKRKIVLGPYKVKDVAAGQITIAANDTTISIETRVVKRLLNLIKEARDAKAAK